MWLPCRQPSVGWHNALNLCIFMLSKGAGGLTFPKYSLVPPVFQLIDSCLCGHQPASHTGLWVCRNIFRRQAGSGKLALKGKVSVAKSWLLIVPLSTCVAVEKSPHTANVSHINWEVRGSAHCWHHIQYICPHYISYALFVITRMYPIIKNKRMK